MTPKNCHSDDHEDWYRRSEYLLHWREHQEEVLSQVGFMEYRNKLLHYLYGMRAGASLRLVPRHPEQLPWLLVTVACFLEENGSSYDLNIDLDILRRLR